MGNGNGKKTDSKATLGEAVGLASQEQLQAAVKAREASENRADKLADRVMKLEKALEDEEEKGTENAGLLADITDNLFEDDERAAKHGYIGALDRAKQLVEQVKTATRKCTEETAKSLKEQTDAERETVKAKGEEARLKRELASATAKNKELFDAKQDMIQKRQSSQLEASALRKRLKEATKLVTIAFDLFDVTRKAPKSTEGDREIYASSPTAETVDRLAGLFYQFIDAPIAEESAPDKVRTELVVEVNPNYKKPIVCQKCGNSKDHFEHQVVAERQLLRWRDDTGYEMLESELEEVLRTESITCGECFAEIDVDAAQIDRCLVPGETLTKEQVRDAVEDLREGAVVRHDKDTARSVMAAASMIIAGSGIAPEVVDAAMANEHEE